MRILYLSQLVPYPLDAGPKVRSYHVLRYLVSAGHEVTLAAFHRHSDDEAAFAHLDSLCHGVHTVLMKRSKLNDAWHVGRSVLNRQPVLIARDAVRAMHQLIATLSAETDFDAVHADQLWMAQYALGCSVPHRVLDQHNAMFLIPARMADRTSKPFSWFWRREARLMQRYERAACREFNDVVWVTDDDRRAFTPEQAGQSIPICVDTTDKERITRRSSARRVTFVGGLHWPPNADGVRWFVEAVWPLVLAQAPDACLTLIGKEPPAALSAAANHPSIEITGFVDSLQPFLAETAAFIVPLHAGGGMRVKILDAWAWGMPIVSTTIGAEGITAAAGRDIWLADSAETFAQAVITLLNDPQRRNQLADAGRQTVETYYDWRKIYPQWDSIYSRPQ